MDAVTGELTGALKDYLFHASNCLKNGDLRFEAIPCASTQEAFAAMKRGEVDCVFPVNLSTYDGEQMGVLTVNPAMRTEISVLARAEGRSENTSAKDMTVAIAEGDVNYETFIKDNIPNWTIGNYPSIEDCFRAVNAGTADGVLVSDYRLYLYETVRSRNGLIVLPTGESMGLSFAISVDMPELYSILSKIANLSSSENMEQALVTYMYSDRKVSLLDFLEDNWIGVVIALSAVFFIIIFLLLQKLKAERKANEQQRLLEKAAEIAELKQTITSLLDNMPGINFTKDAKTGVYLACNQAFAEYAHKQGPEEVIGHVCAEIFDAEKAKRFAEDDRMALSMDSPYIFYEDIPDQDGNMRQIRTTKLKYIDAAGRLCVLGICQDVTDAVRIRRENVTSKESYEKARSTGIIYTHIAQALARGYTELYYIDLNTERYIEYHTDEDGGRLIETGRGWHFFEKCQEEVERLVYPEDCETVKKALDRRSLVAALDRNNSFILTYRLIGEHSPTYVSMKVTRMADDNSCIILGVTDVDEQMQQRRAAERMKEEQIAYARLSALAGDYLCLYIVVPESGRYREFSAATSYERFAQDKEGMDFFAAVRESVPKYCHPEDLNRFLTTFTRENVMSEIDRRGMFTLSYRLMMDGSPIYVQLKAAMVEEKEGRRLIVGVNDIDAQVWQEEEYVKNIAQARIEANIDALTGVKNRHAYLMTEERLNNQIAGHRSQAFAIVILDVNDLKQVNDNEGHKAGDQYLRSACKIICDTFKHSPVFRVGGDEFAVIVQGSDYEHIDELVQMMAEHNAEALRSGGIIIACGMARRENDTSVAQVFERADQIMYENKSELKAKKRNP